MFRSFLKNADNINNCLALLKRYDIILSDTELTLCSDLIKVLHVFEKATDILQGDSYPSLNLASLCYVDIIDSLKELLADENSSKIVETSASFLLENLNKRFPITENIVAATFLDPSTQNLPLISEFLSKNNTDMITLLTKKWYQYHVMLDKKHVRSSPSAPKVTNTPPAKRIRLELIQKHTNSNVAIENDIEGNIRKEYVKYVAFSDVVDDPLLWWKKNAIAFPYLSQLARTILSFPATSASTERHFSESGTLITKKKAQLNPINAQKIMFIHDNFKHVQQ